MSKKDQLITLMQRGQEEILRFAGQLSETERSTSGTPDKWAGRDQLAHIAESKRRHAEHLANIRQGRTPPPEQDAGTVNNAIFEAYRGQPWEAIFLLVERSDQELLAQVLAVEEADLVTPQDRPLWRGIAANAFLHPLSHLGPAYIERGDRAYATRLREEEAKLVADLDDSPQWQGIAQYNLACHYALMGERAAALKRLEAAFSLNPGLAGYSRGDGDLVSLHNDAEFSALVEQFL